MKLTAESTVINDQKINTDIDTAQTTANDAKTIADNTNQYFWFTSSGTDTGAHITEKTQTQFLASPSGGNLLARSNGIAVRDGMTEMATFTSSGVAINQGGSEVASFGATSRIGKNNSNNILTDANGISVRNGSTELATFTSSKIELGKNTESAQIDLCKGIGSITGQVFEAGDKGVTISSSNTSAYNTESDGRTISLASKITNVRTSSNKRGEATVTAFTYPYENGTNYAQVQIVVGTDYVTNKRAIYRFNRGSFTAYDEQNSVDRLSLDMTTGNLTITGIYQSSDRRLKDHKEYLGEDADEFIRKLKPAYYVKDDASHLGFYAQDVEEADKWKSMVGESNGYKTLNYTELIAPLVAYCQHLEKRIEELEKKG